MWGVFGATWYLIAFDVGLDAAAIGVIAAVGGVSSLFGAVLAGRLTRRLGIGPVLVLTCFVGGLGSLFIPLAPAGAPLIAIAFLVGQQLVTDPAMTVFDITDTSVRQSLVEDRQLGRVNATFRVAILFAQLVATLGAGVLALVIGLRETAFLGPLGGVLAVLVLWFSPVRRMKALEPTG
jgi:MFS family permease